jgi:hypothetical protein
MNADWKLITVNVAEAFGNYQKVYGLCFGQVAITPSVCDALMYWDRTLWNVTHIESGFGIVRSLTFEQASEFCRITEWVDFDDMVRNLHLITPTREFVRMLIKQANYLSNHGNESSLLDSFELVR